MSKSPVALADRIVDEGHTDSLGEQAVARAYDQHAGALFNVCLRMSGRPAIAEELTQETFLRAMGQLRSLRDEEHLRRWLFRTATNLAVSRARRARVWDRVRGWLQRTPPPTTADPGVAGEVQLALMQMPEGYRAVLVLHDVAGMTHQEIAEVRGIQPGTAKSQLARARLRLAALLEGEA